MTTSRGDGVHAAPMPAALARRCILAASAVGDAVLDPFGGSGTVGRVAEQEGRRATIIDLDEVAIRCAVAATRQAGLPLG
jgi:DNA modification methylase